MAENDVSDNNNKLYRFECLHIYNCPIVTNTAKQVAQ